MVNKLFLWFIMLFSSVWKSLGADLVQLRAILEVKLKMDDRTPIQMGRPSNKKKKVNYYSTLYAFIYVMVGVFYAFPLWFIRHDLMFGVTFYYTLFLTFLWFTLVVGFSTVLIDTRDNFILLPRPVNDKTLVLARQLHIVIYLLRVVIPMCLPAWVAMGILKGWIAVLFFPFPLIFLVFMGLFLVNAMYLLVIKIAGPKRFKDIISSFQIAFSVLLFATTYIMPRMFESDKIMSMTIAQISWARCLPSYWLAALWSWVFKPEILLAGTQWLSLLAILVPFAAIWATVKWLAPKFVQAISLGEGQEVVKISKTTSSTQSNKLYKKLSAILNRNNEAKAGFELAWLQTARNRAFKMKVYPSLAYIPIYFFFVVLNRSHSDNTHLVERLASPKVYLILLYMCTFALVTASMNLIYSEQYKASWIYFTPPVSRPGNIMSGAFKALFVKYYLPFAMLVGATVIYFCGWKTLPDIIIAQFNVVIFALITMKASVTALPFSIKEQMKERGVKNIVRMMLTFLVIPILGFGHYLTIKFWLLKFVIYPLILVLFWMLWDSYKRTSWQAITHPSFEA